MRQIFTSQRVETVEGVAELLEKNGIDTYISNGRSYQGKRGSQFSYSEPVAKVKQPTVWVRHADDQPRAREILREQGLLGSTRPGQSRLLEFDEPDDASGNKRRWATRIRLVLLALIVAAAAFTFLRHRSLRDAAQAPAATPAQQQAAPPESGLRDDEERIRIPTLPPAAPQR
ncbi:DUF2007 domain-containing protein [Pseudoxanthomonas sp.]|uniref:putative signal transducing protein n=1 Tax=Pseudoxanthomonas sp. TaxID=1871049 RepID=UPI0026025114|nr:DUF2007 domain-containing protein [Pseudoxanthomonas sp.]WDS36291.1 MAG: DUF2007 domain-containing protein [Pseudoxanthomonas sp.]